MIILRLYVQILLLFYCIFTVRVVSIAVLDDLDKYLALPASTNLDLDVLEWWKARDHDMPADATSGRPEGLPALAKMARQYLGRPAASAGVERTFSMAGKMHDGTKASQGDDTLEHCLMAAANTL